MFEKLAKNFVKLAKTRASLVNGNLNREHDNERSCAVSGSLSLNHCRMLSEELVFGASAGAGVGAGAHSGVGVGAGAGGTDGRTKVVCGIM